MGERKGRHRAARPESPPNGEERHGEVEARTEKQEDMEKGGIEGHIRRAVGWKVVQGELLYQA